MSSARPCWPCERHHLATILVAFVTTLVTAGGPTFAAAVVDALNADKVDGKHAVAASAKRTARAGKLVATNPTTWRLPNNIIAKAPDANRLDNLDSTAFLRAGATAADADKLDDADASASGRSRTASPRRPPLTRRSWTAAPAAT